MWTNDDCSVTKVTNYGFNIPAFIKCGELHTVMCIFQASSITVLEVLTSQAWRGTFMKTPTSWCSKTNTHIVLNMTCITLCQLPEEKLLNIEALCKELHIQTPVQSNLSLTMSRWLQDAGSPEGSARDVRSVGSSTAVQTNMDINKMMQAANWTRLTTM